MIPFDDLQEVNVWITYHSDFLKHENPLIQGPCSVLVYNSEGHLTKGTLYPIVVLTDKGPVVRWKGILAENYQGEGVGVYTPEVIATLINIRADLALTNMDL